MPSTLEDVSRVLIVLGAAYPGFKLEAPTVRAYADLLSDLPPEILMQAARQVAAECKFFPSVAEIRGTALGLLARANGQPSAAEAWREIQRFLSLYGVYGRPLGAEDGWGYTAPAYSHDLIAGIVQVFGGWTNLCNQIYDNEVATRAHFMRLYDEMIARHQADAKMLPEVREVVRALAEKMRPPALPGGNGAGGSR